MNNVAEFKENNVSLKQDASVGPLEPHIVAQDFSIFYGKLDRKSVV